MESLFSLLPEAVDITDDSREVVENSVFFAIRGTKFDGHTFIGEVLKKKPLAVVVERDYTPPKGLDFGRTKLVKVENTRRAFALACREFFGRPDERLKVFGVTGTNGKTSTTYILSAILNKVGIPCGVVGTVEYRFGERVFGKGWTTPHPKVWFKTLKEMADSGAEGVAAEISSHALEQYRVFGTRFEGLIFTNLSREHLDYHLSMENYFRAKRRLFEEYRYRKGVANFDDPYGRRLVEEFHLRGFGFSEGSHYRVLNPISTLEGNTFELQTFDGRRYRVETNLRGGFQIQNLAGVLALLDFLGWDLGEIIPLVGDLPQIPGRFEVVVEKPFAVVVDYAHTPDALEKLLQTARGLKPKRVITVFGAGGNRDKTKRPLMGQIAERYSDLVVVTSDNPRWEEPREIIEDILKGVKDKDKVLVEVDRREAIRIALQMAREGDLVLIAGKGHENYQEIRGERYPFDDREVVRELLEEPF